MLHLKKNMEERSKNEDDQKFYAGLLLHESTSGHANPLRKDA